MAAILIGNVYIAISVKNQLYLIEFGILKQTGILMRKNTQKLKFSKFKMAADAMLEIVFAVTYWVYGKICQILYITTHFKGVQITKMTVFWKSVYHHHRCVIIARQKTIHF